MIDTGIDKLLKIQKDQRERQLNRSRADLYNKLFGMLKTIPGKNPNEHQEFCNRLLSLGVEEQQQAILETYGNVCLEKCNHLLFQLASLTSGGK